MRQKSGDRDVTSLVDRWPFAVVPDRGRASKWAGRPEMRRQLDAMLSRWSRRPQSEINVMWADFGQGKTHSLLYLAARATDASCQTHYVQLPPLTSGSPFVALYRQVMRDFPLHDLGRRVYDYYKASPMELPRAGTPTTRSIIQLLWLIGTQAPGADAAGRWLRAERIPSAELRSLMIGGKIIGIGSPPSSAQDCQNALDALVSIIVDFPQEGTGVFLLLIDEFQRIGELTPRKRIEVCDALHLLFNRHASGLRMVLAFAGGMPEIVPAILTDDLISRVNARIDLPPLTLSEGAAYLGELLSSYGIDEPLGGPYSRSAVNKILALVAVDGHVSPRRINVGFDLVTNEVMDRRVSQRIELSSQISDIDVDRALPAVRNHLVVELGEDQG